MAPDKIQSAGKHLPAERTLSEEQCENTCPHIDSVSDNLIEIFHPKPHQSFLPPVQLPVSSSMSSNVSGSQSEFSNEAALYFLCLHIGVNTPRSYVCTLVVMHFKTVGFVSKKSKILDDDDDDNNNNNNNIFIELTKRKCFTKPKNGIEIKKVSKTGYSEKRSLTANNRFSVKTLPVEVSEC